jgi:hypothetical protein
VHRKGAALLFRRGGAEALRLEAQRETRRARCSAHRETQGKDTSGGEESAVRIDDGGFRPRAALREEDGTARSGGERWVPSTREVQ